MAAVKTAAPATHSTPQEKKPPAPLWISNSIFFIGMHVMAFVGVLHPRLSPWWELDRRTAV